MFLSLYLCVPTKLEILYHLCHTPDRIKPLFDLLILSCERKVAAVFPEIICANVCNDESLSSVTLYGVFTNHSCMGVATRCLLLELLDVSVSELLVRGSSGAQGGR